MASMPCPTAPTPPSPTPNHGASHTAATKAIDAKQAMHQAEKSKKG